MRTNRRGLVVAVMTVVFGWLVLFSGSPSPASAVTSVLYDNTNGGTTNGQWRVIGGMAQSFTTGTSAVDLTEVQINIRIASEANACSNGTTSTFGIELWSDSSGVPGSKLATIESTQSITCWNEGYHTKSLGSPPTLDPSTRYFVVVYSTGFFGWKCNSSPAPSSSVSPTPTFVSLESNGAGQSWSTLGGICAGQNFLMKVSVEDPSTATTTSTSTTTSTTTTSTTSTSTSTTSTTTTSTTTSTTSTSTTSTSTSTTSPTSGTTSTSTTAPTTVAPARGGGTSGGPGPTSVAPTTTSSTTSTTSSTTSSTSTTTVPPTTASPTTNPPNPGSAPPTASSPPSATTEPSTTPTTAPATAPETTSAPTSRAPSSSASTTPSSSPTSPQARGSSDDSTSSDSGSVFSVAEGEDVDVIIDADPGEPSARAPIVIRANNLTPSSPLTVTVYSDPQLILDAQATSEGTFEGVAELPADLEKGRHTVVIETSGPNGPVTVAGAFSLESDGTFDRIAQPRAMTDLAGPGDQRLTRSLELGRPVWDPGSRPMTTALIAVTAMSVIGLAGAGGVTTGMARREPGSSSDTSAGGGQDDDGERRKNSRGKLAGVVTKKLKGIKVTSTARGDVSSSWALPATAITDEFSRSAPNRVGKYSAAASRVLVDGAWLRAMFGSFGYLPWLVGIAFGAMASFAGTDSPLTPTPTWLSVIVVLGILDAGAGASAWLTISALALATGSIGGWPDVRTILGLFVLLATPSLLAHVIRPLRRYVRGNSFELWERVFDYVMMPVFVAFATGSMLKALNGLSGLEIVSSGNVSDLRWIVWASIIGRLACEDIASHWYPERMAQVQPAKLASPGKSVTSLSIVVRSFVFLMICEPFFGLSSTTLAAALLLAVPQVMKMWEDDLPNSVALNKWFPRGLFRFFCTLVLGAYMSSRLIGADGGEAAIKSSFIWLLLPGVIIGVIELFGRSGGTWPNVALRRSLGAFVWLAAAAMVTGHLNLFS